MSVDIMPSVPSSSPAPEAPSAPKQEASQQPSSQQSSPQANEAKEAQALAEKKESGEKLTKKEEQTLKEYKLKVNGREKVVKFNPFDDNEVTKYLQKAEASDSKFQEAAEVRKAAMEFIEQLRKNPRKVLSDPNIGVDVKKFAEDILNEEIKEMEKSPEQREKERLQKELEELKKQAQEREETAKRAEFERLQLEQERILENEITAALDVGNMPKTPYAVKRMAEMMMIALENNIDLSPKDVAHIVKNNTMKDFKELLNSLSDDQVEDFIGKDVIGRIRKKNIAKVKAVQSANNIKPSGTAPKKEAPQKTEKITYKRFFGV